MSTDWLDPGVIIMGPRFKGYRCDTLHVGTANFISSAQGKELILSYGIWTAKHFVAKKHKTFKDITMWAWVNLDPLYSKSQ